eukprot:Gb_04626 [translate_table: standard]
MPQIHAIGNDDRSGVDEETGLALDAQEEMLDSGQPIQRETPGGAWYMTDRFCGEIIFHRQMLEHPCRTDESESAMAFYVPFYAGMYVRRFLWSNYSASDRDRDCRKLLEWVRKQKY